MVYKEGGVSFILASKGAHMHKCNTRVCELFPFVAVPSSSVRLSVWHTFFLPAQRTERYEGGGGGGEARPVAQRGPSIDSRRLGLTVAEETQKRHRRDTYETQKRSRRDTEETHMRHR